MDSSNLICRVCLEVYSSECSVIKENIISLIKLLTAVDVGADDKLPKVCCSKCTRYLNFVEKMRRLIIRSDVRLRNVLTMDGGFRQLLGDATKLLIPMQAKGNAAVNCDEQIVEIIEIKQDEALDSEKPNSPLDDQVSENNEDYFVELTKQEVSEDVQPEIPVKEDSKNSVDVLRNILTKLSDGLFHCNVCNIDIQGSKASQAHKSKHMQKTCEICGVTTRSDNFSKHKMIHKLGQQICHICGSKHKSFEGLRSHMFHFHNEKKVPYTCEECGAKFKYSGGLCHHRRKVHLGFRPYQCESCGKSFFDLETMKKHVKLIHLKLREHPCEYCKKQFSSRYALKVHKRQHTHETPYVCDICSEGFHQLVSLKTHLAKHQKNGKMKKKSSSKAVREDIVVKKEEESFDDEHLE